MKKVIYIALIILWLSIIFFFSNENGSKTQNRSKGLINSVLVVYEKISNIDIDNKKVIKKLNYGVRKCAHFTEYFVLSILVYLFLNTKEISNKYIITIIICFLCANFDEIHQIFKINRTPSFKDVLLDTSGSIVALYIYHKIKNKNKKIL